jgi:uncharacterized protein with von Willebrand factor type A (vWA) domain
MIGCRDTQYKSQMSTVLMIDIPQYDLCMRRPYYARKKSSHGAGRGLQQDIKRHIDILVFGNDAWTIAIKDLPYLKVGPFHTNTVLLLAMDLLEEKGIPTNKFL